MTAGGWIAVVSVGAASLFSVIGLVVQGLLAAFHFGRHAQRLTALEERTRDVEDNSAALAVLTSTVGGIDKRLVEVAHDVKKILTGRVRPAPRRDHDG